MVTKNVKSVSKPKGYQIVKSNGKPLFKEVYTSKLEAAENLIITIQGSIIIQERKNESLKKPKSVYSNAAKYLDCRIIPI